MNAKANTTTATTTEQERRDQQAAAARERAKSAILASGVLFDFKRDNAGLVRTFGQIAKSENRAIRKADRDQDKRQEFDAYLQGVINTLDADDLEERVMTIARTHRQNMLDLIDAGNAGVAGVAVGLLRGGKDSGVKELVQQTKEANPDVFAAISGGVIAWVNERVRQYCTTSDHLIPSTWSTQIPLGFKNALEPDEQDQLMAIPELIASLRKIAGACKAAHIRGVRFSVLDMNGNPQTVESIQYARIIAGMNESVGEMSNRIMAYSRPEVKQD